jgi:hypothetical protein
VPLGSPCLGHVENLHSLNLNPSVKRRLVQLCHIIFLVSTVCHVSSAYSSTCPHLPHHVTRKHRTDMPCFTLAVVTRVTLRLVHLYLPRHQSVRPVNLPCQLYGPFHISANCSCHISCTAVRPVLSAAT